jgi:hypothetical protein
MAKKNPQPDPDGDQYCRKDTRYDSNVVLLLIGGELLKGTGHEVGEHDEQSGAHKSQRDPKGESSEIASHVWCPHNAALTCRRPSQKRGAARLPLSLKETNCDGFPEYRA